MTKHYETSPEFLADVFHDAPVGLCLFDTDLRFVYINDWLAAINGLPAKEHLGRTISEVLPDVGIRIEPQLRHVIETGEPILQGTVSGVTPAEPNVKKHFQHSFRAVRSSEGLVEGISCVVIEVTERKIAEDALQVEQELLKHIFKMQEGERRLTAFEIHDGILQYATGALMHAHAISARLEENTEFDEIRIVCHQLEKIISEGRRLMDGLRPMVLDEMGLIPAIEHLISEQSQTIPKIIFENHAQFNRLAPPVESSIFRIVQEALTNANKYSQAETVNIILSQSHDQIHIEIRDSGTGFDPEKVSEGRHGLSGMKERVSLLGGTLKIDSAPGRGTRITAEVPILINR